MEPVSAETLFDALNIKYEEEYADNQALMQVVCQVIEMLEPGSQVLDLGCGTGKPVASMLAAAGMHVTGIDISQKMIDIAQKQVVGSFSKADMVQYEPSQKFDAIFVAFSHMQLSFQELHSVMLKYAACLRVGGLILLAAVPSDNYVQDKSLYDETGSYLEDSPTPFMGMQILVTLFTANGLIRLLQSIGLDIVDHKSAQFQPKASGSLPEDECFIIAKRAERHPLMGPYPLPGIYPRRNILNSEAWPPFVELACRRDIDAVLEVLESNKRVVDIGSGHGELPISVARRVGTCYAVEPDGARNNVLVENGRTFNVNVLQGTAEHIPLGDKTCDATVAMWVLHYVDDLEASLSEMVRVVDPASPDARIIVVQGAPDCEAMNFIDKACTPYIMNDSTDKAVLNHQGYFLHVAAKLLAANGFGDISLRRVNTFLRFTEPDLQKRCDHAAEVLANFWFLGHPRVAEMKGLLVHMLEKHFKKKPFEIGDRAVMLVARPSK